MRIASLLALLFIAAMPLPAMAQPAVVEASGAWIRIAPPGAMMLAGYLTLTNNGDAVAELESLHSEAFGTVELHRTEIVDGVSRMRAVPNLRIAPGESVQLQPGSMHLMLMQPAARLGESVVIVFDWRDGSRLTVALPLRHDAPGE
jgi:copper(I)-binding protein